MISLGDANYNDGMGYVSSPVVEKSGAHEGDDWASRGQSIG